MNNKDHQLKEALKALKAISSQGIIAIQEAKGEESNLALEADSHVHALFTRLSRTKNFTALKNDSQTLGWAVQTILHHAPLPTPEAKTELYSALGLDPNTEYPPTEEQTWKTRRKTPTSIEPCVAS